MSEQLTVDERNLLAKRCLELYGETTRRHGRAVEVAPRRFVVDCLSCRATGAQPVRPGRREGDVRSFVCPRCRGTGLEVVTEQAAERLCGADRIDYQRREPAAPRWRRPVKRSSK